MKAIRITDERMAEVLPSEIKNTDVLSDNAKKTLATIMNYFVILDIARTSGYLVCPNSVLREAVGIRNNDLINAVQELIECDLIERQVGHKRVEGEKSTASTYKVKWPNLVKPIKKKNTFEELFSEFLKSPETLLGTTVTDIVSDIDIVSEVEVDTESEFEDEVDAEPVIDNEIEMDKEVEMERQFEVACGVQVEESEDIPREVINQYFQLKEHPEEEDLSKYLKRIEGIKVLEAEYPQLKEKILAYTN